MPAGRRQVLGPGRSEWGQQILGHTAREDRVRSAKPDVGLWIGGLGTHPVVDILRAHVEPPDVYRGVELFVGRLHQGQKIPTVRRVEQQRCPPAVTADGAKDKGRDQKSGPHDRMFPFFFPCNLYP